MSEPMTPWHRHAGQQRAGDYIVAVVNTELVTAVEVERRLQRAQEDARRASQLCLGRQSCASRCWSR